MKRPRGHGLARKLADVLADAPRPMLLGELEAALDFEHQPAEIMSVLVKLQRAGKVTANLREREGPGRKQARAYAITQNQLGL
ncbi:hypothetical protein C8E02_0989 [Vogesella indigofera]|uniref:Uncharacterized protein n=1 Tax=Vogesella indigofera TaxID=45465 RepID=A0A495BKT6_VOGIN|nr:hypothetical protein [Vogesella indigofera]RKQ61222.1 hypothetical protein C8E02_0989 [Vogesella indigofera]